MNDRIKSEISNVKNLISSNTAKVFARMKHVCTKVNLRAAIVKYGYYGALAVLLVILGIASNTYRNRLEDSAEAKKPMEEPMAVSAIVTPVPAMTPEPVSEEVKFAMPVSGEVIAGFADTELVWSDTLGLWQTHTAVDISGAPGESVTACSDGVVSDTYSDPLWGNVIEIEHSNGMKTVYRNTGTLNLVKPGDQVASGDIISTVGKSASAEAEMPWHVHVELYDENGTAVDIMEFIGNAVNNE